MMPSRNRRPCPRDRRPLVFTPIADRPTIDDGLPGSCHPRYLESTDPICPGWTSEESSRLLPVSGLPLPALARSPLPTCYTAEEHPGGDYDLVTIFDVLHDLGDPVGASAHVLSSLSDGSTFMLVEPLAGDSAQENLHPLGQIY